MGTHAYRVTVKPFSGTGFRRKYEAFVLLLFKNLAYHQTKNGKAGYCREFVGLVKFVCRPIRLRRQKEFAVFGCVYS